MSRESRTRTDQEPRSSATPDNSRPLSQRLSVGRTLAAIALAGLALLAHVQSVRAEGQTPTPADAAPANPAPKDNSPHEPQFDPPCDLLTLEQQKEYDLCRLQLSSNGQQIVISRSPNTASS